MDYGVTITRGAAPWQIFQQGPDGTACIRLEGKYHLVHLSLLQHLRKYSPFVPIHTFSGKMTHILLFQTGLLSSYLQNFG